MGKRDWLAFDYRSYTVTTSVSAMEAFQTCERKWWLNKVHRLPEPPFQAGVLGDAFHALCELYLLGNDSPTSTEEWRKELSTADVDLLSRAFSVMVQKKVLQRQVGLQAEKPFQIKATPRSSVMGFIDAVGAGMVIDHKTSKSNRYFVTRAKLATDFAMLTYARAALEFEPSLKSVTLRHNQVVLDSKCPDAAETSVEVPVEAVHAHWANNVVPIATRMVVLKGQKTPPSKWSEIPGTDSEHKCHSYGRPCPYYDICHSGLSPDDYRARNSAEGI